TCSDVPWCGGSPLPRTESSKSSLRQTQVSSNPFVSGPLVEGSVASVFDAPVLPTSRNQCRHGGWRNFPQFKNRGQCVAFVERAAIATCLTERAQTGRAAFRNKYGVGRRHRH